MSLLGKVAPANTALSLTIGSANASGLRIVGTKNDGTGYPRRTEVRSRASRPASALDSRPSSISRVRSGPRFALPIWFGVIPGFPSSPAMGDQERTASKAPGAFPASPIAARSLSVSHLDDGQKG